jgi:hypothetical protein
MQLPRSNPQQINLHSVVVWSACRLPISARPPYRFQACGSRNAHHLPPPATNARVHVPMRMSMSHRMVVAYL